MTEAAQANLDGLECSSYAWQVRRFLSTRHWAECQEYRQQVVCLLPCRSTKIIIITDG